jgi:hypothetical protein
MLQYLSNEWIIHRRRKLFVFLHRNQNPFSLLRITRVFVAKTLTHRDIFNKIEVADMKWIECAIIEALTLVHFLEFSIRETHLHQPFAISLHLFSRYGIIHDGNRFFKRKYTLRYSTPHIFVWKRPSHKFHRLISSCDIKSFLEPTFRSIADFPKCSVKESKPFLHTGVHYADYAGLSHDFQQISGYTRKMKPYRCLFLYDYTSSRYASS